MQIKPEKLTSKFLLGSIGLLLGMGMVVALVLKISLGRMFLHEFQEQGIFLVRHEAGELSNYMLTGDVEEIRFVVNRQKVMLPDVSYIFVVDTGGNVAAHTFKQGFPVGLRTANPVTGNRPYSVQSLIIKDEMVYDFAAPVLENSRSELHIGFSAKSIDNAVVQIVTRVAVIFVVFISGIGLTLPLVFNRVVVKPLRNLSGLMEKAATDFNVRWDNPVLGTCWKIKDCQKKDCPVYGKKNERCWQVGCTLCGKETQGNFARKQGNCRGCKVFKQACSNEITFLGEQFNNMLYQLSVREEKLKNSQAQLVLSEKMASLGVLIAGIAHEINTPTGAVINATTDLHGKLELLFERAVDTIAMLDHERRELLKKIMGDLYLSHMKDMAAGSWKKTRELQQQLAAYGIDNCREVASILARFNLIDGTKVDQYKNLLNIPQVVDFIDGIGTIKIAQEICLSSAQKIAQLVKALKYYAYTDMDKTELLDINEGIENVLVLMHNKFKYQFDVVKQYGDIPRIYCTSEINQVWTNLLSNAYDAVMEKGKDYRGKIGIETGEENGQVVVKISDNGEGIPPENMSRIFDPFFTTKGIGKGVGLGLSIVSGIVKKHGGEISVESTPETTTFTVSLPKEGYKHA